jgi:MSHA biogenesis protein MshO
MMKKSFGFRISGFELISFGRAKTTLSSSNPQLATRNSQLKQAGFTLVEMIVAIAILGIISAIVAVFIRRPVEGYVDSVRRAELSDVADTALRRITRDLRLALPNSIRVANPGGAGTAFYLEFLITSGGGRYRTAVSSIGPPGDPLDFTAADLSFDVLSPMPAFAGGESIVIYNLGTGFSGADAYAAANNNRAAYAGNDGTAITLAAPKLFPLASPGNRFHVVQYAVTYACDPVAREIRRYWNYGVFPVQVGSTTPPGGGSSAPLARDVNACTITYDQNAVQGRNGVVSLSLQLTGAGGEAVNLFQESHVTNVP